MFLHFLDYSFPVDMKVLSESSFFIALAAPIGLDLWQFVFCLHMSFFLLLLTR